MNLVQYNLQRNIKDTEFSIQTESNENILIEWIEETKELKQKSELREIGESKDKNNEKYKIYKN